MGSNCKASGGEGHAPETASPGMEECVKCKRKKWVKPLTLSGGITGFSVGG